MRELIQEVRKEAVEALSAATEADSYHKEQLNNNATTRANATYRIKQCDEALEALNSAARHLVGKTG